MNNKHKIVFHHFDSLLCHFVCGSINQTDKPNGMLCLCVSLIQIHTQKDIQIHCHVVVSTNTVIITSSCSCFIIIRNNNKIK